MAISKNHPRGTFLGLVGVASPLVVGLHDFPRDGIVPAT